MKYTQRVKNKVAHFLSFSGLMSLSKFCKISFLVGSWAAFFSGINIIAPLTGAFGTFGGTAAIFGFCALIKIIFFGFNPFLFLFKSSMALGAITLLKLHVPGFFGSLGWRSNHWSIHVALPLVCMALFMAHPVGGQAYLYSFYWLIPVSLYFMNNNHLFLRALRSTFIAHAVGSVLWSYGIPMTPTMWLGLIPVVFVERIVFAAGMILAYRCMTSFSSLFISSPITTEQKVRVHE